MIESDDEDTNYMELSPMPRSQPKPPQYQSAYYGRSPSPIPETQLDHTRYDYTKQFEITRPTLPSPKEIFRASPMSMQNILSNNEQNAVYSPPPIVKPSSVQVMFPPTPADDEHSKLGLFARRTLPLPALLNTNDNTPWLHHHRGQLPPPPSNATTTTIAAVTTTTTAAAAAYTSSASSSRLL
jgi:hypothetical protein